jgi:hypothetical protein
MIKDDALLTIRDDTIFKWKINFTAAKAEDKMHSPLFSCGGHEW